ncbi:hypothetical protein BH11ARM2_BH11ARM2_03280 [soil metagenome]
MLGIGLLAMLYSVCMGRGDTRAEQDDTLRYTILYIVCMAACYTLLQSIKIPYAFGTSLFITPFLVWPLLGIIAWRSRR